MTVAALDREVYNPISVLAFASLTCWSYLSDNVGGLAGYVGLGL